MVAQTETDFDFLADLESLQQPQTQTPHPSNVIHFPEKQAQSNDTYDFLADLEEPQAASPVQKKQAVSEVPDFIADFEEPKQEYNSPFFDSFDAFKPPKKETATEKKQSKLLESFSQGLKESASGEIVQQFFEPGTQENLVQDPTFWESLVKESGTITGDLPYMAAGATLGGIIGSPGGPIGSTVGGAFGAMAMPAFLKESLKQYREYQESGKEDLTFGEFLQKADKVANRTLNEGLFGVILGATAKAVPMLQKLPGIGSLFNSKVAQTTSKVVAEAGVATAVPAAVQGRLPEAEDFAHALALFAGFNLAHLPANAIEALGKQGKASGLSPEEFAKTYDPEKLARIQKVADERMSKAESESKPKAEAVPEGSLLRKPEDIRTGSEGGKATASFSVEGEKGSYFPHKIELTTEERRLIEGSQSWEKAGDHQEAGKLAQEAREMIFERLKGQKAPETKAPVPREVHPRLKEIPQDIFRGSGRESKESVYGEVAEPILGEGKYYAFSEEAAKEYGPKIESKKIDLKNPLVIRNDAEWREFTKKAGLAFPNPIGANNAETKANVKKIHDAIKQSGHDGAVIYWEPMEKYGDVNTEGKSIKTLGKIFDTPQVFELPRAEAKAPTEKPQVQKNSAPSPITPIMKRNLPQPPANPIEALAKAEARRATAREGKTLDEAISFEAQEPKVRPEPKNEFDFRRDIVDDLYPIKRFVDSASVEDLPISQDPYRLARLYRGWSGKADTFLEFRTFDPDTLKWKGNGLRSILNPVREDLEGFSKYLVGKRAIELAGQKKETGISLIDAQEYVKANQEKYEKPAKQLKKYQSDLLHYAEKSGLISPETRQLWETMNENYVPFQRVLAEPNEEFINARTMQPKQQFYKLEGSKKPIIDPLESIVSNSYTLIRASEQNRVLRSLRDFNDKYKGSKEFIEVKELGESEASLKNFSDFLKGEKIVDDDGVVRFFDDGKLVKMKVPAEVAEALKGIRSTEELNFVGKILNYPTRAVRTGAITLSPGTLAKLATIDQLEAFLYTDIGYIPYYDAAKGFFHAIKKDPLYYKWKAAGGDQSIATSLARSFKQQKLHNVATGKNIFDSVDSMLRAVENVSKPLEESTRLGVFEKALKRKGMSADDVRQAALEAREATLDFQRKGACTRLMAQAVPFFNASIQGAAKFYDHLKTDPKLLPKAITAVTLPTLMNYYINKDRKEFQELPQWERDAFWHFYVDLPNGDTQHYKMPRPFELGAVFATVPERLAEYAYEQDKDSLAAIGENLKDTFLPSVMPAALTPFYEVATNKKLLTGAPLVTERMKNLPTEERHSPFTSETAKKISPILQKIPYVGEHASPVVIEEFLNAWTGNLGTAIVHYSEKGLEKTGVLPEKIRPEKDISDLPIFKVFVGKKGYTTQARSLKKFYDESDKLQKQYNAIRLAAKEGRESTIDNPNEVISKHKFAQKVRTAFSKSWTAIRNIQIDHDPEHYNEAEKKILIDSMIKDMVSVSREFLGKER